MNDQPRALSAKTKNRNTPESDALPTVPHLVTISDGRVMELMASDPLDAIKQANELLQHEGPSRL